VAQNVGAGNIRCAWCHDVATHGRWEGDARLLTLRTPALHLGQRDDINFLPAGTIIRLLFGRPSDSGLLPAHGAVSVSAAIIGNGAEHCRAA
jgi:hypothetical protein